MFMNNDFLNISKDIKIRKLVHSFQINFAYNPPRKFDGSCLDGRDITYNIVPDAEFKFFITHITAFFKFFLFSSSF